eukprot:gnl/Spiro4/17672_TR9405_c0_g1_i1.p1 gnl/Spiro4/17672_TR9405_c0_g1~~gnl/Spiro4/17672_TR9405_c0_g1_i1.p1  ORF type:complete len:259 (-),score=50.79 gnl/Spiro4/17672_TR9405_c0_g1_i1:54-830(-)
MPRAAVVVVLLLLVVGVASAQQLLQKQDLTFSTLSINAGSDSEARLILKSGQLAYSLVLTSAGVLELRRAGDSIFKIDETGSVVITGDMIAKKSVEAEHLIVGETAQWRLFAMDHFSLPTVKGWSNDSYTMCDQIRILGGPCKFGHGEVFKTFTNLPDHSHVEVNLRLHLLGSWAGETIYVKVDGGIVFAESYMHTYVSERHALSVCDGKTLDGKYGLPVSIVISHNVKSLAVSVGSTLSGDRCTASWGIGSVEVSTR